MSNQISNTELVANETTELVKSQSIPEYMAEAGLVSVSKTIRVNANGYPYITMLNKSNEATNVYFGKKTAATVVEGQKVDKAFFAGAKLQIVHILNKETGLILPKFAAISENSTYSAATDLF